MSAASPPASPIAAAPSSLEAAWAHLKRHLAWAEPPWIVFVFAAGSAQSRQLAERAREALAAAGRTLELRRPGSPEALRDEVRALLDDAHADPVYVDAVRQSLRGDDSWTQAWLWLAQRLNERRDHLLRMAGEGLVLAIPTSAKADVRTVAPDLWTIRSLALELRAEPDPRGAGGFVWLTAPGAPVDREVRASGGAAETMRGGANAAEGAPPASPIPSPVPSLALALTEVERAAKRLAEAEASGEEPALCARLARRLASAELDAAVALRDHYRLDEALAHARAGVERLRVFNDGAARAVQRELGRALGVEAGILGRLGRTGEALAAGAEAAQRQRDALRGAGPLEETVRTELVATLLAQSAALRGANRLNEALEAAREAVDLSRAGEEGGSGAGSGAGEAAQTTRAACLSALGTILRELERADEALPVLEEAIASWRALVTRGVGTARARLPSSLGNLASVLASLELPEASLEAVREAVAWLRALAAETPEAFRPDLAVSLTHLSVRLRALGRSEEAAEAAREAAAIRRELASSAPETFGPGLALSLTALARARADLGALPQARVDSREAIDLLWPYFEEQPLPYAPWMRQVLADAADVFADEEPEWLREMEGRLDEVMARIEVVTD